MDFVAKISKLGLTISGGARRRAKNYSNLSRYRNGMVRGDLKVVVGQLLGDDGCKPNVYRAVRY